MNYSDLKIPNYLESKFDAQIEKVTNDTYLKVFQNNLVDKTCNARKSNNNEFKLKLYLEKDDQNLTTGIEVYENLGTKHSDRYQYTYLIMIFQKI